VVKKITGLVVKAIITKLPKKKDFGILGAPPGLKIKRLNVLAKGKKISTYCIIVLGFPTCLIIEKEDLARENVYDRIKLIIASTLYLYSATVRSNRL
jgi:hypothetical protein